jgi:hypothetical protein
MKQLLLFITLITYLPGWATDPTSSASNVAFPANRIEGGSFYLTFTAGTGTGRIIVVKEGSEITGLPIDGKVYNASVSPNDARFEVAGNEFENPGEYVVFKGGNSAVTVTNLKPNTIYYIAIFEYNTSGTPNPDYLAVTPTGKFVTTHTAPTSPSAVTGFSLVAGNRLRVNWTNGNGTGRIIIAKKGSSLTAIPEDLKRYTASEAFGSGNTIEAGTFAVYKISATHVTSIEITNLEPNTTYTFAAFEFNGDALPVYLKTLVTKSVTTHAGPTIGTGSLSFGSIEGNSFTLSCTRGNGMKRLVIAKKGSAVTAVPVNGVTYTANAAFGAPEAEIVPGSGEYVVFSGDFQVSVTNLEKLTTYHFAVYEYDEDANGYKYYLTSPQSSTLPSRGSQTTVLPPTGQTTLKVNGVTGSSVSMSYVTPATGTAGSYRMLVMRQGGPITFEPEDLKTYSGSGNYVYPSGQNVGSDTYVIVGGSNGGMPTITGLMPGQTYYFTVFDLNGRVAPMYLRPGFTTSITIPNEPASGATSPKFPTFEGNYLHFQWTSGTGAKRIVVARKGAPVANVPQDGVSYTSNAKFGSGTELVSGSGEFVVYNNAFSTETITGLESGTTYHFAVFEYNEGASGPDYLTASGKYLTASQATVSAPTTQVSNLSASGVLSDRATINFTPGNGSSRLFVMREAAAVAAEPVEFKTYNIGNSIYGSSGFSIGENTYVVAYGKTTSFTVTGLKEGTDYYITAFEYNSLSTPVYLRPGAASYSFTTTGGIVNPTPAQASHTPVFENVDGNKFTFKWSSGDGANRIVVARKGAAVTFTPSNGTEYTANAAFGSGLDLGGGQYIVYKGSNNNVDITQLEPSTTYHFTVFEYNGSGGTVKYLTASYLHTSNASAIAPTAIASGPLSTVAGTSITLGFTPGNGDRRLVVIKEGSDVTATPANMTTYAANARFKDGAQMAVGEYVVYAGTGNSITVTNISPGKNYHFAVFEYNGSLAPVYNTTTFLRASVITTPLPVTWVAFTGALINSKVRLDWVTAQEINNSGYEIERSNDGVRFHKIGALTPNSTYVYQYLDLQPLQGAAYYRIKQLDQDGAVSYSKTIKVHAIEKPLLARLLQNPVESQLKLQGSQALLGGKLQLIDAGGKVLQTRPITTVLQVVDLHFLQKGIYYLQVLTKEGENQIVLPFIKN